MVPRRTVWHPPSPKRVVAWLGKLDEAGRLGIKQAADEQPPSSQRSLFAESETEPEWAEVDVKKLRVEHERKRSSRYNVPMKIIALQSEPGAVHPHVNALLTQLD